MNAKSIEEKAMGILTQSNKAGLLVSEVINTAASIILLPVLLVITFIMGVLGENLSDFLKRKK